MTDERPLLTDPLPPSPQLAELLTDEPAGQKLLWSYDIGDNWFHVIEVEAVRPAAESSGRVEVLAGAGACPPEDSNGCGGMGPGRFQVRGAPHLYTRAHMCERPSRCRIAPGRCGGMGPDGFQGR